MYLTEKLVLLIETQLDTPLLFPNILAVHADGLEVNEITYSLNRPTSTEVTAGDPDVSAVLAEMVGEEAVGGTVPTPDQSVVDDIADAAGVSFADKQPIRMEDWLNRRDRQRWELDPDSAEHFNSNRN